MYCIVRIGVSLKFIIPHPVDTIVALKESYQSSSSGTIDDGKTS